MALNFVVYFETGFEFHMEPNNRDIHEYVQDFRKTVIESFDNPSNEYDFITTYHPNKKNPKDFKFRVYPKSIYSDEELASEWTTLIQVEKRIRKKIKLEPLQKESERDIKQEMIEATKKKTNHGILTIENTNENEKNSF